MKRHGDGEQQSQRAHARYFFCHEKNDSVA
jgi:hypothetical protein